MWSLIPTYAIFQEMLKKKTKFLFAKAFCEHLSNNKITPRAYQKKKYLAWKFKAGLFIKQIFVYLHRS